MSTQVSCPQCQKSVVWDQSSKWRPFCSERCKLIDLGQWAEGSHRIAGDPAPTTDPDAEPSEYH